MARAAARAGVGGRVRRDDAVRSALRARTRAVHDGRAPLRRRGALLRAPRGRREPPPLRAGDLPRLVIVASLGAVVAPVALAWGLQRTSGVSASLLLNLEAVFTVLLARALMGASRSGLVAGGALLAMTARRRPARRRADGRPARAPDGARWRSSARRSRGRPTTPWAVRWPIGIQRVSFWRRARSERGPRRRSRSRSASAGPAGAAIPALALCGALGYGASLTLYLRAQRAIGAARTGSIFAAAPFVGAALAWAMGERAAGPPRSAAGALLAVGLVASPHRGPRSTSTRTAPLSTIMRTRTTTFTTRTTTRPIRPASTRIRTATKPATHVHAHGLDVHHRHRH